jgi:hypothetical protein
MSYFHISLIVTCSYSVNFNLSIPTFSIHFSLPSAPWNCSFSDFSHFFQRKNPSDHWAVPQSVYVLFIRFGFCFSCIHSLISNKFTLATLEISNYLHYYQNSCDLHWFSIQLLILHSYYGQLNLVFTNSSITENNIVVFIFRPAS